MTNLDETGKRVRERERERERGRETERTRGRERKTEPERERRRDCTSAEATIGTRPGSDRATTTGNDVAIETRAHRWPLTEGHRQTPLRDRDLPHQAREAPGRPTTTPAGNPPTRLIKLPRTPHSEAKPSPAHPRRGLPYRAPPISTRPHTGVQAHGGPHVSDGQVNLSSFPSLTNYLTFFSKTNIMPPPRLGEIR